MATINRFPIPFPEPTDGWQEYERHFFRMEVIHIYRQLDNPIDKFVLMAVKDLGYPESVVGDILGVSQAMISKRLKKIITRLQKLRSENIV